MDGAVDAGERIGRAAGTAVGKTGEVSASANRIARRPGPAVGWAAHEGPGRGKRGRGRSPSSVPLELWPLLKPVDGPLPRDGLTAARTPDGLLHNGGHGRDQSLPLDHGLAAASITPG